MGIGNILLLSQVTVYLLIFIFSLFIFIPLTVNEAQFDGHCLLFATGEPYVNDTEKLTVQWGSDGYCKYPIVMSVIALPLSVFYMLWMSLHLFKDYDLSWVASFIVLVTSVAANCLTLVAGIILTTGFNKWCDVVSKERTSCDMGEFVKFDVGKDIDKSGYYVEFGMAQFATWVAWFCWLMQVGFSSLKLFRLHQQEDFFTSMRRERMHLIQRISNKNVMI